jgi:SLOG cluster3 family
VNAIFLSASVPLGSRANRFPPADRFLIQTAVRAFVLVALGRRLIVWGGHPGITPMVWTAGSDVNVDFEKAVRLYQSEYFEDNFPKINQKFKNVRIVKSVPGDLGASLRAMRSQMLADSQFDGAVFIGGMDGIEEEFQMFREKLPGLPIVLVDSGGGATATLASKYPQYGEGTNRPFDYFTLFSRRLGIGLDEDRAFPVGGA